MSPVVRPARAADAAAVADLAAQLGYPTDGASVARRLEAAGSRPSQILLVAAGPGTDEVLGWAEVGVVASVYHEPFAEILGLVVDAGKRGRGIGRALVAAAETWAAERGVDTMRLRSNVVRTEAHAFYRGLGYAVIKTQHAFGKPLRQA